MNSLNEKRVYFIPIPIENRPSPSLVGDLYFDLDKAHEKSGAVIQSRLLFGREDRDRVKSRKLDFQLAFRVVDLISFNATSWFVKAAEAEDCAKRLKFSNDQLLQMATIHCK